MTHLVHSFLVASVLLVGSANPVPAEQKPPQGVLSGPVESMGKNRKIMPLPKVQIDSTNVSPDATPAERPSRPFSGWVGPRGCDFPFDGSFLGRVQDGRISGMAAEGANFDWPVAPDGTFGGQLLLRQHESGDQMFQWIAGRVEADHLSIDVEFGAPDRPDTFCRGSGITLKIGG